MGTREHLIDLGERAIRTAGFGGFSYADLAREAGIKKASIHHHFPSKADLGLAVLERYCERLEEALVAIAEQSSSAGEALSQAVQIYRAALGNGEMMCLCSALAGDGMALDPAIQYKLSDTNRMVADWLAKTCEIAPEQALSILAQLQGAQLVARASSDVALFDAAVASIPAQKT